MVNREATSDLGLHRFRQLPVVMVAAGFSLPMVAGDATVSYCAGETDGEWSWWLVQSTKGFWRLRNDDENKIVDDCGGLGLPMKHELTISNHD